MRTLHEAMSKDDPARARRVELILSEVDSLPTLSPIATRLLELSSDDESDIADIVALIESDPSLTGKILGLCRRADKGLGARVSTVRQAVLLLGLEAVQAAVLSVSVFDLFEGRQEEQPEGQDGLDRVGFWRHAVAVACASELIAEGGEKLGVSPEEAFVGGLLHDLGKLVLGLVVPRSYAKVVQIAEQRHAASSEIERAVIGIDHHIAGKRLAEHWSLPHALQDVIWLHGQGPASVPDLRHKNMIGVVTLAKSLCRALQLGWSGEFDPPPNVGEMCENIGVKSALIEKITPLVHERVAERCAALGIDNKSSPELLLQSVIGANRKLGRMYGALATQAQISRDQSRVLEAISDFHRERNPGRGVADACRDVVRSAAHVFGEGYYGVLFRSRRLESWQLCRFTCDGRMVGLTVIETTCAEAFDFGIDPSQGCAAPGEPVRALPWLQPYVEDAPDSAKVRVLVLERAPDTDGPTTALVHDRPLPGTSASNRELAALASTWASSVAAAAQHEGARRLGEKLAETNRRLSEMQAKWADAQSLVRLGEMAAGAAHEMNNPLTVISGRSQLLAGRLDDPKDRASAGAIAEAAQDLSNLITSLRILADPPSPATQRMRVRDVVADAVSLAHARGGLGGRVAQQGDAGEAEFDPGLIQSALAEVLLNALEASPEGAVDVIASRTDECIRVEVRDRGPGFSERAIRHAFDPFFSEKPAGRQTGLGLARARRLVELHGGEMGLANEAGGGALVWMEFPIEPESRQADRPRTPQGGESSSTANPGADSRAA